MLSWETSSPAPARSSADLVRCRARKKPLVLSINQRVMLHRLLHRDLRKCTGPQLDACQRSGWSSGAGGGHELTAEGRRIAELSEQSPPVRTMELSV